MHMHTQAQPERQGIFMRTLTRLVFVDILPFVFKTDRIISSARIQPTHLTTLFLRDGPGSWTHRLSAGNALRSSTKADNFDLFTFRIASIKFTSCTFSFIHCIGKSDGQPDPDDLTTNPDLSIYVARTRLRTTPRSERRRRNKRSDHVGETRWAKDHTTLESFSDIRP